MRTFYTVVFAATFLLPCLFIIYGVCFSIILLFVAINSGDYSRFSGVFFGALGGGMGFFAAAQLLDLTFNYKAKIMCPFWIKSFLFTGLLALVFTLVNSPENFNILMTLLLLMPIPTVLYLMFLNRHYLWVGN